MHCADGKFVYILWLKPSQQPDLFDEAGYIRMVYVIPRGGAQSTSWGHSPVHHCMWISEFQQPPNKIVLHNTRATVHLSKNLTCESGHVTVMLLFHHVHGNHKKGLIIVA